MMDQNLLKNRVTARYRGTGYWTALTGLHPGGEADDFENNSDMALLRSSDGSFFIPGASIAGAARSRLEGSYRGRENETADVAFFGSSDYASLVTVFDARVQGTPMVYIRDGVRVHAATGVAEESAKYDFEVLPAGTAFDFEFQVVIYERLPQGVSEAQVLARFLQMLKAFQEGHIHLGARTRRGLGRGNLEGILIRRLDMTKPRHVLAWLERQWDTGDSIDLEGTTPDGPPRLRIEADLKLKSSLLIRSAGDDPAAPDMVHLTEEGRNLLTGTSMAGALRQRCLRIANTMGLDGTRIVESMFGPAPGCKNLRASRVWVQEQSFKAGSGDLNVQGRVSIDRFTGGALESHLFDEAAFWPREGAEPLSIVIELDLQRPPETDAKGNLTPAPFEPKEPALLLQAFKDLWLGDLSLGGEAGAGRGAFEGVSASFSYPGKTTLTMKAVDKGVTITSGNWEEWNQLASLPKPEANHV